ncbi:MAG: class A beta-lactamase [Janthinobacterium lividum]
MVDSLSRRTLLVAGLAAPLLGACTAWSRSSPASSASTHAASPANAAALASSPLGRAVTQALQDIAALERATPGSRLGVSIVDAQYNARIDYRANERFPMCSTFKILAVGAVLRRSEKVPGLLEQRIRYTKRDLVAGSPISQHHVRDGMTVAALCAAALQYSDNTAANMLLQLLGGPPEVTAYARAIGDPVSRLDRRETVLNQALPGDPRDTTTPAAMAANLQRLLLGDALAPASREQFKTWLLGNTTGAKRLRGGLPAGWRVADKTGSGDYGTANDVGLLYTPTNQPIVVTVYLTQADPHAAYAEETIAGVGRIVARTFA